MWVFGYGSLMWDNWELQWRGTKHRKAKLLGYHRAFNKSSTKNWGTQENPGPTLGLEADPNEICVGCAFQFDDDHTKEIKEYLKKREGSGFDISRQDVVLWDNTQVQALTPINKIEHETYIGRLGIEERVRMAKNAIGENGRCIDYITNIYETLIHQGIDDVHVTHMYEALEY